MAPPPEWCDICTVALVAKSPGLGPGGAEALALAEEIKAGLILLDGRAARTEALRRGLLVSGLIGVLLDAAEHGLINLQDALDRLVRTSFYMDIILYRAGSDYRDSGLGRGASKAVSETTRPIAAVAKAAPAARPNGLQHLRERVKPPQWITEEPFPLR